jgi:hypothetical protein
LTFVAAFVPAMIIITLTCLDNTGHGENHGHDRRQQVDDLRCIFMIDSLVVDHRHADTRR